jgi:hypothetical protein
MKIELIKTTTYLAENGKLTKTVTMRPIPTREEMARIAQTIRDAAREYTRTLTTRKVAR